MNEYRVFLQSEKSWLELHKPNTLSYDIMDFDEIKARIQAIKLNDKELGKENDYCVIKVIIL